MTDDSEFERLVEAGLRQSLTGWDFSWLNARAEEEPLPWDYRQMARERIRGVDSLLDVGTGGGEFFAAFFQPPDALPVPQLTWASEGYPPNVILARERLALLGIPVADTSQAVEGKLPFPNDTFAQIINRHTGLPASELYRTLKGGGHYLTQQVGGQNCIELNHFLGGPEPEYAFYTSPYAIQDLQSAGLHLLDAREYNPRWTFRDVAGIVFYLKSIPWQIPGFTVEQYRDKLHAIHQIIQREGGFTIQQRRILLEARKL